MKRFNAILDSCLQIFIISVISALIVLTFGQVVGRYFFGSSYGWVEELSILLLCWAPWPTACILIQKGSHLRVTVLVQRLPQGLQRLLRLLTGFVSVAFLVALILSSKGTLEAMEGIPFVSLPLPSNVKFYSVPVGAALMIYYFLRALAFDIKGEGNGDT